MESSTYRFLREARIVARRELFLYTYMRVVIIENMIFFRKINKNKIEEENLIYLHFFM